MDFWWGDGSTPSNVLGQWMTGWAAWHYLCDVIKQNESELANIDFKIQ